MRNYIRHCRLPTVFLLSVVLSTFTIIINTRALVRQSLKGSTTLIYPSTESHNGHKSQKVKDNVASHIIPLNNASQPTTRYELCFLTSVFADDLASADIVGNVTEHRTSNPTFQYLAFTNRESLVAPGWEKVVPLHLDGYKRLITKSRWAKFVPWQHDETKRQCPVIFYLDGYTLPVNTLAASKRFRDAARLIQKHPYGLGQYPKRGSRVRRLAQGLVRKGKDTKEHINTTMAWLDSQSDFRDTCSVYLNRHFVLDPNNVKYQQLSSYFWELYSQEEGSWRDQLLWCYVVDKFRARPVNLYQEVSPIKALFEEHRDQMGYNGHTYVVTT